MKTLSQYKSDCGTRTATVHQHKNLFIGRTDQGGLFEHELEQTVENWCEDYVQNQNQNIVELDQTVNLKPSDSIN